jgi:hypothetical protein
VQVFYLDSIDLGDLNMPHNIFPRAQCFTADRIKAMAASDACRDENGERLASVFGASMVSKNKLCLRHLSMSTYNVILNSNEFKVYMCSLGLVTMYATHGQGQGGVLTRILLVLDGCLMLQRRWCLR